MPNATARYVITADDKTKGAIASVKRGFDDLDKGARKFSRGLKGIGLGALALKAFGLASRYADESIQNLAKSNADFAKTLTETNAAFEDMKRAGPLTVEAFEALNKAAKDPALHDSMRQGADLVSRLVTEVRLLGLAWSTVAAKALTALGVIDKAPQLDSRGPGARRQPLRDLGDVDAARKLGSGQTSAFDKRFAEQAKAAAVTAKAAVADVEQALGQLNIGLNARAAELVDGMQLEGFGDAILDSTEGIADRMSEVFKQPFEELTPYAEQAARNMQDTFAEFLFDPFDDGIKGMLRGFIDVIRRMVAEAAAAKIFGSKASGGFGFGDAITGFVGGLFGGGKAAGGPVSAGTSYLVGERGPELFTPRVSGAITPNHALVGGVVQNITVDARGATVDAIRAIPAAMAEAKRQAVAEVQELVRRGRL